jgi:hypothetical protein
VSEKEPVVLDSKTIHEVLPDIPTRKTDLSCKACGRKMGVWGAVIAVGWEDYLDGSGDMIYLCDACGGYVVDKIKKIIEEKK